METVWAENVHRGLNEAVELLRAVVGECPDELWCTPMWRVKDTEIDGDVYDGDGSLITDPGRRQSRVQRWSEPWSVAWHVLEVFDYDLVGELDTWTQPAPFAGNPHWKTFSSRLAWSKSEIIGYADHCLARVRDVFAAMTDDKASTPLPSAHRYAGTPYAWLLISLIGHTTAHAIQIRQFTDSTATPPVVQSD